MMKHYNIPIFINHIGCPNSCVFCSQKKINGVETDITPLEAKEIVEKHITYLPKNSHIEVAFFGGTFTGISFDLQREYLEVVKPFIEKGEVKGIRISTRPDCIDEKILEQLKKYDVKVIELGVQSLDQNVLDKTERNYSVETVEKTVKLIKKWGISVGIQLMLGLPMSSAEIDIKTAEKAISMEPDMVRVYPSLVLKGTKMEEMYRFGEYSPISLEEAIYRTVKIYPLFIRKNIKIIRVGLQPSEDLQAEGVIVAGPFHAAFRELVEGDIFYNFIVDVTKNEPTIEILCNEKDRSKIIGNKSRNRDRLGEKFTIKTALYLKEDEIEINGKRYSKVEIFMKGNGK